VITIFNHHNHPPRYTTDYGSNPFVADINKATLHNDTFRTALWTGAHLQLTLMTVPPCECIGLELHPDTDQFLRVEQGQCVVQMGSSPDYLYFQQPACENSAIFIPAGTWHNVTNTGRVPLKLYSIYAPPHHPWGTVHCTKAAAEAAEKQN
jgi:mannose-6-phosphate isomerase-like protein (cupin superfamily)